MKCSITIPTSCRRLLYTCVLFLLIPYGILFGLHNQTGAHDPTAIQKCGNTYWIFTTGDGISSLYSRDLVSWSRGRTPFSKSVFPSWIKSYVPDFDGHFWAPECIYINGAYHLYYSCSTWGSKNSCIGLVTNKTLNPEDPDFLWEDKGVVVSSNSSSEANCIDPSVFRNELGDYYLTYGSYFGGIRIVELDSLSGKVDGSYHYPVASGNCEASYVIPHNTYYYLFINRGSCCKGMNSTYHIQVGRSLSPVGPFLDKEGINLNNGGGSTIFSTNGSLIGPGHVGYFVEEGEEWVTYHYYDGDRNGAPTLGIGTIKWLDDWPVITNEFFDEGAYVLLNHNSQMVIQTGEPQESGGQVVQGSYTHLAGQKWQLKPVGNGYYSINALNNNLVVETEGCSFAGGTRLLLGEDNFMPCEHWKFERTNGLEYVISSRAGNQVVDVPAPAFEEGVPLQLAPYSGAASHYWALRDTVINVGGRHPFDARDTGITLFPVPSFSGFFTIRFDLPQNVEVLVEVFSMDGRRDFNKLYDVENELIVRHQFEAGVYLVRVISLNRVFEDRLIVL